MLVDESYYSDNFGLFEPAQCEGLGLLPPGFFESPATWPGPTAYAVAAGATGLTRAEDLGPAGAGVQAAVDVLAPHCDRIVADCGLFYRLRDRVTIPVGIQFAASGLELVPTVLEGCAGRVGILTHLAHDLDLVLPLLPEPERLAVLPVQTPTWRLLAEPDFALPPHPWTRAALLEDLLETAVRARQPGGAWEGVEAVVIECTFMAQFREALAAALPLPIFDVRSAIEPQTNGGPRAWLFPRT